MHILEIPSFLPPYGGYFCIEQARALKALGHEVRVLIAQQLGVTVYPKLFFTAPYGRHWVEEDGIELYRSYFRGIPSVVHPNEKRYCRIVNDMFDEYVAKHGRPDILHAHCCKWAGVVACEISKRTGIPFFITEHLSHEAYERDFGPGWTKNRWAKQLMQDTYEAADCVIPVARELVDGTKDFFGCNYRWREISNLIDVSFFSYHQRQPLTNRPFRFCCLAIANGKWFYYKGYDVLLEAFKGIPNAELHIAGRSTNEPTMQQAVKGMANVVLHGDLDKSEVRDLLFRSDALVLASRGEVQPLVLLEAMSTGIPVVSTEVVPQSERIPDACVIVPVGDADALHNALLEVMRIQPSKEISRKISELASPDKVARKLEQLFKMQWKS